jgi:phosphoribosylamine--glycine ligase
LVTSGIYGWTLVVTGTGPTVEIARHNAYRIADGVFVPNLRFRRDIGDALIARNMARLVRLGLLSG